MNLAGAIHLVAAQKQLTEETVRPGLIGLFFFVALFVALYFLWRSMNKQLKKADAHFAAQDAADAEARRLAEEAESGDRPSVNGSADGGSADGAADR